MAQIASFYAGAMSEAREIELGPIAARVGGLDLVVIGANDPEAMLRHTDECRTRGIPFAADPSPAAGLRWTATSIRQLIDGADLPVHQRVRGRADRAEDRLERTRRSSTGSAPGSSPGARTAPSSTRQGRGRRSRCRRPARSRKADPTGVGDAFRAGFLAGLAWGLATSAAPQVGSLLATYVIETVGTQEYDARPARASSTGSAEAYGDEAAAEVAPHLALRRAPDALDAAMPPPVEPPAVALAARPSTRADPGEDLVGGRRRPRAGHPARGLPRRPVPDGPRRRTAAGRSAGGRRTRAACCRRAGCGSAARCARPAAASRSGSTPPSTRSSRRCADPRRDGRLDHPRDRRAPTPAAPRWAGRTRVEALAATASSSAASTASRSAACSPGSRCSTTPRDASKVALVALVERRLRRRRPAAAARRAVGHAAPGEPRRP